MFLQFDESPIIACSSGTGHNVAISLIRISGLENFGPIEPLIKSSIKLEQFTPRKSYLIKIIDGDQVLDDAIMTVFQAPDSYTGENVIELGVHGNRLNVERIIDLFCKRAGLRKAYGGEFTHRALKNNKLNLSQVEGLDLLLNANNLFSLKQGFSLLSGGMQDEFLNLYKNFLNHRSSLELNIDFLEDMGEAQANKELNDSFLKLKSSIDTLYRRSNNEIDLTKAQVALFGPPNAGKSTFFNLLLGQNRSIVSSEKGTTRDYISENIKIDNEYFELVDTAGIRKSENEVEAQGIERSLAFIGKSFFKILLINPLENNTEFLNSFDDGTFDVLLLTHADLDGYPEAKSQVLASHGALANWSYGTTLLNSPESVSEISAKITSKHLKILENEPVSLDRHKQSLQEIYEQSCRYENILEIENDVAIISSELYILGNKVEELLGVISPDDVLKNIFDNFCIGK